MLFRHTGCLCCPHWVGSVLAAVEYNYAGKKPFGSPSKNYHGKKKRRIRSWRLTRLRAEPHRRSHYPVSFREHKSCCSDGCWMQLTIAILMDFLSLVLSWVDCVTWNFSIVIKVAAWYCLNRWNVEIILLCAIYRVDSDILCLFLWTRSVLLFLQF